MRGAGRRLRRLHPRRLREKAPPLVYSFTRAVAARFAFPIVVRGRVAGVIYASRTPRHILQRAEERDKLIFADAMAGMLGLF